MAAPREINQKNMKEILLLYGTVEKYTSFNM